MAKAARIASPSHLPQDIARQLRQVRIKTPVRSCRKPLGAGTASVPLTYAHIGATGTVTLAGAGDIVEFHGTSASDTFSITGSTLQVFNSTGRFRYQPLQT